MNSWDFFDQISIISIPEHHSRITKIRQNFKKVHLYNYTVHDFQPSKKIINNGNKNFSLWSAFNHTSNDETSKNIALNHLTAIREAYYSNKESILIFENDAEFKLPFNFIQLQSIIEWLKNNQWNIFYFGYCPVLPYITKQADYIVKIHKPLLGHAYALSRSGMKRVLTQSYLLGNTHIDKFYTQLFTNMYGAYPILNFQNIEPAIYRRIKKKYKFLLSFTNLNKGMEKCGLFFSFLFRLGMVILSIVIVLSFLNKHYIQLFQKET